MIPQPYTMILPVLASNLAAWLRDDGLPRWLNYAIIAACFIAAAWASLYLGGHLTGDVYKDAAIVIVECLAVFQALQPALARSTALAPSPLLALRRSQPGVAAQGRASQAVAPPQQSNWKATTQVWPAVPMTPKDDQTPPS